MSHALANIPAISVLLCERCGYALTGLPPDANCPECGQPASASDPARRGPSTWEMPLSKPFTFISTTLAILFHPSAFYRSLLTRLGRKQSIRFARIHWLIAALLFGAAAYVHMNHFVYFEDATFRFLAFHPFVGIPIYAAFVYAMLGLLTPVAARLTSWEAAYRGLRLPLPVVQRGLDFHAANYLPVALLTALTIIGYCKFAEAG
ncbi:MAG TPA: hypothetical protein VHS31_13020, partial [Tepidisphaeraceae bacterium]|nr:hypothetical protein [Tepidisphaeraceae bacterium]